MKSKTHSAFLLLSLASLLPMIAQAQAQVQRLSLPRSTPLESAGSRPQSVAIGGGKIAFGSTLATNLAGVSTGGVHMYDEKTGKYLYSLYPADGGPGDEFGYAVAIQGTRLLVGAPRHDDSGVDSGVAYFFDLNTRRQTGRTSAGLFLTGELGGSSVALDGAFAYVGAPNGDFTTVNPKSGFVVRFNPVTNSAGPFYLHSSPAANDFLGNSVAASGGLIVAGAPGDDVGALIDAGSVQLFSTESNSAITALVPGAHAAFDNLGETVAIEGNTVVAGGSNAGGGRGKVASWDVASLSFPLLLNTISGSTPTSFLGCSVSIHQGLIAAGALGEATTYFPSTATVGAVWLYDRNLAVQGALRPSTLALDARLGSSVTVLGNTVAASAPGESGVNSLEGALYRFSPVLRSQAQLFSSVSVVTGDSAAGAANTSYSAIKEGAATGGAPVLLNALSGTGSAGGRTLGVWTALTFSGAFSPVARTGIADFAGLRYTTMSSLLFNPAAGHIYWRSTLAGTGVTTVNNQAWVRHDFPLGTLSNVLRTGQTLSGGEVIAALSTGRVNQATATDFGFFLVALKSNTGAPAVTPASDSALVVTNNGTVLGYQREGVALSSLGTPFGQMPTVYGLTNEKSTMVATAVPGVGVTTANNVYVDDNGTSALARKGNTAPDDTGLPLSPFSSFRSSTRGTSITFQGTLGIGGVIGSANNEGLWSKRVGALRLVMLKGSPAPVIGGGVKIARILKYGVNTADNILVLVQLSGTGVNASNDQALYLSYLGVAEPGSMRLLLREGDVVPGTGGAKLASILGLDLTSIGVFSNSHYGVLASLVTQSGVVTTADNLVWLVGNAGGFSGSREAEPRAVVILRKGTRFQGFPGQDTITSISMIANPADSLGTINNGLPHSLGINFGQSTLKITFANRKTAVVTALY